MTGSSDAPIRVLHVGAEAAGATAKCLEREDDRLNVRRASTAREGLDRLDDGVDCIVSDYDLPATNGIEFLETVRETRPDLPFVLFTGAGSERIASDAIAAGVTDYLPDEGEEQQYVALANRIGDAVDRYRTRRRHDANRRRCSRLIEQAPLGVLECDEEYEIVGLNRAGEEILGYTEEELRGDTWETLGRQSQSGSERSNTNHEHGGGLVPTPSAGETERPRIEETVRGNGERIACEWHDHTITDDGGEVVAILSLFQDVTDRQSHEERLRRTTARLEVLFENSPDMIDIHDADGTIVEANPRLCEVTGYAEDELVGMKVWDLDEGIDPDEARSIWESMAIGDRHRLEGTYRCRDGSTVPVEVHLRRLDLNGDHRFMVISRDISARIEYERRLEATTARYRALVENFPNGGVFMFDENLEYTLAGGEGLEHVGLAPDDFLGRRPDEVFPADIAAKLVETYRDTLAGTEHIFEQGFDEEHYRVRTLPVRSDDGEVVAGLAVTQNVTEQKRREERLSRQKERLEEFAGVVSHDLRNPLAVAEGYLEMARTDCESEHLETVANAHRRMRVLIEDLLVLAREGYDPEAAEEMSIAAVARTSWRNVETADATLLTDTERTIQADRSQFQQLLENLFRNSVEHGGESVTVTVGDLDDLADSDDGRGFYVADDGTGISEADRTDVFESGYSTATDGTGFGLYIVGQLADRHGWTVRLVESDDGGARFEFDGVEYA
jgi:PAS domain S-box-containing protein